MTSSLATFSLGASCSKTATFLLRRCGLASLRELAGEKDSNLLYEPKFVDTREFPEYPTINVRIQGYDYVPLEKFQAFIDRTARRFKFDVVEGYAVAAQTQKMVKYKTHSTVAEDEIDTSKYERVVRLDAVAAPRLGLFTQLLHTHLPIGVTLTIKEHEKSDESNRYIPDILLKQKQDELKALDDPNVRRNLGWE